MKKIAFALTILIFSFCIETHARIYQLEGATDKSLLLHLNEGSGGTAYNSAGVFNGTITNSVYLSTGVFGTCLDMNGVTSTIVVSSEVLSVVEDMNFTFMCWVNMKNSAAQQYLFTGIGIGTNLLYLREDNNVAGYIRFAIRDASNNAIVGNGSTDFLNTGWHHVALAVTGTGVNDTATIYVDGIQDITPVDASSLDATGYEYTDLDIGHNINANELFGCIEEVIIFNDCISAAEIKYIYESQRRFIR